MADPKTLDDALALLALTDGALAMSVNTTAELRGLLAEALEDSIHAPACAYLHHDVDPKDVGKCNCWKGRTAKLLGKPTPPATGVKAELLGARHGG